MSEHTACINQIGRLADINHDLLAALRGLVERLPSKYGRCRVCGFEHDRHNRTCQLNQAQAAIAKAEGLDATLVDTRKNWTPNEWTGHTVISDGKEMTIRPRED